MIQLHGELFAVDSRFETQMAEAVQRYGAGGMIHNGGLMTDDRPSLIVDLPLDGIAIMQITGCIARGQSYYGPTWDTIVQDLAFLKERPGVKGVVLMLDSPGGSAMGCEEACDAISQFGKPISAYITGYGLSASYRIACHCDQIFATKSAQVGSIGTAMVLHDHSKVIDQEGVRVVAASTGPMKTFGTYGLPITEEHQLFMQERVAIEQAGFVASLTARGLTAEQQVKVADGRYWSAPEAVQLGLIDGIKSRTEVIEGTVPSVKILEPGKAKVDDDDDSEVKPKTSKPAIMQASAGISEGSDIVSEVVTSQPAAVAGEVVKQGISTVEIRQLCPGAPAEFVLQQFEALQAEPSQSAQVKVLQAFNAAQKAQLDAIQQNQSLASVIGTAPVGSTQLTQTPADGDAGKGVVGGPIQQFEALVDEAVKGGMPRQQAVAVVVQEHAGLHNQYLTAIKQMSPEDKAARRARNAARVLSADFSNGKS